MGRAVDEGRDAEVRLLRLAGIALIVFLVALNVAVNAGLTQGFDMVVFSAVNFWSSFSYVDAMMIVFSL